MAQNKADIYLLFGVQGGGKLDQNSSGKQIQEDLLSIAQEINQKPIEIKFKVSEQSKQDIRKELEAIVSAAGVKAVSEAARVQKAKSSGKSTSAGGSSTGIDNTVSEYRKARKEIETILHGLESSINSAKLFDNGMVAGKFIEGAEALKKKLTELDGQLIQAGTSSEEFESEIARLGWRAKATTDNIAELIGETKNANKFGDIYSNSEAVINGMLKKIESERASIEKSIRSTNGIALDSGSTANVEALKRELTALNDLEKKVVNGDTSISKSGFADRLSDISLAAQQSKKAIGEYVNESKKAVDQQTALIKIENERARIQSALRKAGTTELNGEAEEQVEWLQMSIDELDALEKQVKSTSDTMTKSDFAKSFNDIHGAVQKATHSLNDYVATEKQAVDQSAALSKINSERASIESQIAKATELGIAGKSEFKVEELKVQLQNLDALKERVFNGGMTKSEFNQELGNIKVTADQAKSAVTEYVAQVESAKDKMDAFAKIDSKQHDIAGVLLNAKDFSDQGAIESYKTKLNAISEAYGRLKQQLESGKITTAQFEIENQKLTTGLQIQKNRLQELIATRKQEEKNSDAIKKNSKEYADANEQITKSLEAVIAAEKKYGKNKGAKSSGEIDKLREYKKQLEDLSNKLETGTLSQKKYNEEIKKLQLNVGASTALLEQYKSPIEALGSSISQVTKEFIGFYSTRQLVSKGASIIKDMIDQSVELETAFADTRIVTHASAEELENYANTVMDTATKIGTSVNDLVSATTTYARLGYSLDEASILAEFTGMLERVGNIDTQKAEDAVTAILKAFPDEADVNSVERIMDMLVQTGNNAPISVSQIAEGMTNASSALAAANNDFKQSVALLTAANTTVQNASKSSTALRTISARIRKTKSELDDLGETMEESTYENLVAGLTKHNVMLTDINGEYRSTYDIMKDISEHWSEMTNMEQSALAEAIAGNRQQTVFYSLIENFGEAEKAMEGMVGSAGSLSESYSVYLDTTAAHVQQFNTQWQTLSKDFVDSNMAKGVVDFGTTILKLADSLAKLGALLPAIITLMGNFKTLKLGAEMLSSAQSVSALTNAFIKQKGTTAGLLTQFQMLTKEQQIQVAASLRQASAAGQTGAAEALLTLKTEGLITAETGATVATNGLGAAFKTLMLSNPLGWISMIVSGAMMLASWINKCTDELGELEDDVVDVSETTKHMQQTASDFRSLSNSAKELIPKYVELSKGVNALNENISLSDDEYKEFIDVQNQLADLFPSLKLGVDENGNAFLNLAQSSDELTESLYRQLEVQRLLANQSLAEDMSAISNAMQTGNATGYDGLSKAQTIRLNSLQNLVNFRKEMVQQTRDIISYSNNNSPVLDNLSPEDYEVVLSSMKSKLAPILNDENFGEDFWNKIMAQWEMAANGNSTEAQALQAEIERQMNEWVSAAENALSNDYTFQAVLSPLKQGLNAWAQMRPEYEMIPEDMRGIVTAMIGAADPSVFAGKTEDEWKRWVEESVLKPLQNLEPEAKIAISNFMDTQAAFQSGAAGAKTYSDSINTLRQALKDAGVSGETTAAILNAIGASGLDNKIKAVYGGLEGELEDINDYVDKLSQSDIELAYSILATNGSMTIDELTQAMIEAKEAAVAAGTEITAAFDVKDFFDGIQDAASKIDTITSAMEKLSKGTALTTKEMLKLAEQYPELLKQSNFFTDGSIAGQKAMLKTMLDVSQKEYEAEIDINIQKLNAELEAVQAQIKLEKEKQLLRAQIYAKSTRGLINLESDKVAEVSKLNQLESNNFVTLEDGKVTVNEKAMNKINSDTYEILKATVERGWNKYAEGMIDAVRGGTESSMRMTEKMAYVMSDMLRELGYGLTMDSFEDENVPQAAKDAIRAFRDTLVTDYLDFSYLFNDDSYRAIFGDKSFDEYSGSVKELTGGLSIEEWYKNETINTDEILSQFEQTATEIENQIGNLEGLKAQLRSSLESTFSSVDSTDYSSSDSSGSASSGGTSTVEKLGNEFKEWYDRAKHDVVMGNMEQAEFIAQLQERLNDAVRDGLITEEESWKYLEEIKKALDDFTKEAEKSIDALVQYRVKMLKDEAEKEKDVLNKRISTLKDFYDKQKQMLRDQQSEEKYQDEQGEKRKKIAALENEINQLKTDYSAEAQKRRTELKIELNKAKKDLSDFEKDHAYDAAEKALDDEYERQAAEIQSVIDTIDASLNDPQALYNIALNDIRNNSESIYDAMMKYGQENGNGKTNEASDLWNAASDALEALKRYWSLSDPSNANASGFDGITSLQPYATGTRYSTPGFHRFDENGSETIFTSANGNKYRMFSAGEKVLNADASDFLYKFAESRGGMFPDVAKSGTSGASAISAAGGGMTSIQMGDIIINGNADERTVSEIRRAQRETVDMVLREFSKLKR